MKCLNIFIITAAACIEENRNFIGIEKDPKEFNKAIKRISILQAQTKLFKPEYKQPEQVNLF